MKTKSLCFAALVVSLSAFAAGPEAMVVVTRKSGVALPRAMAAASEASAVLQRNSVPVKGEVSDATSCKTKKPCLVELGRKAGVSTMVLVELGSAVDSGLLRVEAISVEEDGRRLALSEAEGPLEALVSTVEQQLTATMAPALLKAMGLPVKAAVVAQKPVEPVVVKPVEPVVKPVEPTPVAVVKPVEKAPEAAGSFWSTPRAVGAVVGGAGAATLIASAVFGATALGENAKALAACPAGQPCNKPEAYTAWANASGAQNTGLLLAGIGGAALLAGGAVFLLNPGASSSSEPKAEAAITLMPTTGGAFASISGRF